VAERPDGFIAVDRFHRSVSALCMVSGVVLAGSVVWGSRRFWLFPGHALPAAALTVTIAVILPAWLWMWSQVWRTKLSIDDAGLTVRNFLHTDRISWPEVGSFADGLTSGYRSERLWALRIVLHDGRVVTADGTAHRKRARPDTLAAVRQAAERHAVPAGLTGEMPRPGPAQGLVYPSGWVHQGHDLPGQLRRANKVAAAWLTVTVFTFTLNVVLYIYVRTPGAILGRLAFAGTVVAVSTMARAYERRSQLRKLVREAAAVPLVAEAAPAARVVRRPAPVLHLSPRMAMIAGGVAATAMVAFLVAGFLYTSASSVPGPSANQLTVAEFRAGDCLAGSNMDLGAATTWPAYVTQVDCDRLHEGEVVFAGPIWPSSLAYPGATQVDQQVNERCEAAFATYDGVAYERSALSLAEIAPDAGDWGSGDRSVQCVAYQVSPAGPSGGMPLGYSIKGSRK
jgi:hypothetical protein